MMFPIMSRGTTTKAVLRTTTGSNGWPSLWDHHTKKWVMEQ
jgi:hypothetical protein